MPELILLILLTGLLLVTVCLALIDWRRDARRRRRGIILRLASIHYEPKTKLIHMTTNLRSPVSQFAQILLHPTDANGKHVKLDTDAIVVDASAGARTSVQVLDRENGDRDFLVNLIPGDEPGENTFTVRGDAQPGEGAEIIEEVFIYTATPNNAVSLGATVTYLPKTSLPV